MSQTIKNMLNEQNRGMLRHVINELRCEIALGDYSSIKVRKAVVVIGKVVETSGVSCEQTEVMKTEEFINLRYPLEVTDE